MLETIKRQKLFFISLIGIVVVSLTMGITYAYQSLVVDYKEGSDSDILVEVGKLNVSYENNNNIDLKNMTLLPDYKTADYTEFTIKTNDTSYDVAYQINLKNLEYSNTMISENFMYTITLVEDNNEFVIGEGNFSSLSGNEINLPFNMSTYRILEKGNDETLRLYLWLQETKENQNSLEGTSFKGNIELVSLFANETSEIVYKTLKVNGISSQLPNEYQQVEYIKTTGTQYIDSEVPLKSGLKIIVDWIYNDSDSGNNYTGAHIGSPGNRWLIGSQRQNNSYYFAIGGINLATEFQFGNRDVVEAYWEKLNSHIIVNGVKATKINWKQYDFNEEPNYTFYMGATNRDNNAGFNPKLTIYNWKFYQEDVLIRDFIPCYRKTDNAVGMYDLVTNTFYHNRGTGEFETGNNIIQGNIGEYDETIKKYKLTLTIKTGDVINSTFDILLNEPLRKFNEIYDYIDFINGRIVRNIKVDDNVYSVLEEPVYEKLDKYRIPYIENSNISVCYSNNVCTSNIEIELNK